MVGNSEPIDVAMETFYQHGVVLNVVEGLQNYLSWEGRFSMDKKWVWLEQLHFIVSLKKKFGHWLKKVQTHKMQGMPKFLIIRPIQDSQIFFWGP